MEWLSGGVGGVTEGGLGLLLLHSTTPITQSLPSSALPARPSRSRKIEPSLAISSRLLTRGWRFVRQTRPPVLRSFCIASTRTAIGAAVHVGDFARGSGRAAGAACLLEEGRGFRRGVPGCCAGRSRRGRTGRRHRLPSVPRARDCCRGSSNGSSMAPGSRRLLSTSSSSSSTACHPAGG